VPAIRVSKGATITKVDLPSGDDHIVFDGVDGQTFTKAIQGKKVVDVGRKGKYFYVRAMLLCADPC